MHGSWFAVALYKVCAQVDDLHTLQLMMLKVNNMFDGGHGHEDWMLHPPVLGDGRVTAIQYLFPVIATNDTLYCREQYTP